MNRTFLSKVSGAVVALALGTTTLAAVGAAAPAGAATAYTCATVTSLTPLETSVPYGSTLPARPGLSATCNDASHPNLLQAVGTLTLFQLRPGAGAWKVVSTKPFGSYVSFADAKVDGTSQWKLSYSGGTKTFGSGSTAQTYTWLPSESTPVGIGATPLVSVEGKRVRSGRPIPITWTSNPATRGVLYVRKPGKKKWKVYKRVSIRPTGTKFRVKQPAGTKLRFVIPASANLGGWTFQTRITRSRF